MRQLPLDIRKLGCMCGGAHHSLPSEELSEEAEGWFHDVIPWSQISHQRLYSPIWKVRLVFMFHLSFLQMPLHPRSWESRCCPSLISCAGLPKGTGRSLNPLLRWSQHMHCKGCSGLAGDLQRDCISAVIPSSSRIPPDVCSEDLSWVESAANIQYHAAVMPSSTW